MTVVAGHPTADVQDTGGLEIPGAWSALGVRLGSRHQYHSRSFCHTPTEGRGAVCSITAVFS